MHIEIHDNTVFRSIQDTFSNFYPYLKLEFYKKAHRKFESSDKKNFINPDCIVSDIKKTHLSALIEIQPSYKVSEVEKEFQQRLGLPVQILWKGGQGWKQTVGADNLTLKELNEISRNSSDEFILSNPNT